MSCYRPVHLVTFVVSTLSAAVLAGCGGTAVIDEPVGTGGSGGGGQSALTVRLGSASVSMHCMPAVPPDPVSVTFSATYDNSAGTADAEATLLAGRVDFGGPPQSLRWSFELSPTTSSVVAAGATITRQHQKVPASGSGDVPPYPCDFCATPSAVLEVDYWVDGRQATASAGTGPIGCTH
jgi:hypothetical protein